MTVLAIGGTHRAASDRHRARRRPSSGPGSKHASARATCLEHPRRNHRDVFPQVASGVRPFAARCRVGSQSYNDPLNKVDPLGLRPGEDEFWGPAHVATLNFTFPVDEKHRWLGEINVAGFIPQAETSLMPLHGAGPRLFKGDDRGFTAAGNFIDPSKNRFFARLDFSAGTGFMQVNPTCRTEASVMGGEPRWAAAATNWDGDCSSARPIQLGSYDGNNILDPKYDKNYVNMQRSGDTYRFKWSLVHSDQGIGQDLGRPRVDAKVDFKFVDGGNTVEPSWSGDCFPSVEVMRVSGGTTQVIGRVDDAGAEAMAGGVTNLYNAIGRC